MRELSVFVDESGDAGEMSVFYLITLVLHDQSQDINPITLPYENDLRTRMLEDIPMHLGPLLNGNDDYKELDVSSRKAYLSSFRVMVDKLPFRYITLAYRKEDYQDSANLFNRMKRDLVNELFENLEYLQRFDKVKIYYDNGQSLVTNALHDAVEYALSKNAIVYRNARPENYRLFQLADYICTLELTALKYQTHAETSTDRIFFGQWGSFKKNYLKKIRKKRLN